MRIACYAVLVAAATSAFSVSAAEIASKEMHWRIGGLKPAIETPVQNGCMPEELYDGSGGNYTFKDYGVYSEGYMAIFKWQGVEVYKGTALDYQDPEADLTTVYPYWFGAKQEGWFELFTNGVGDRSILRFGQGCTLETALDYLRSI